MAKTGTVIKAFRYAADGVNVETLAEGRVLSFPDVIFDGLESDGHIEPSDGTPENSVDEARSRDAAAADGYGGIVAEIRDRLKVASDQDLKDIIARSGYPVTGNLVHSDLVGAATEQLRVEAEGKKPVLGVDPNAGVTEHPLAAPGAPTPPSAVAVVTDALAAAPAANEPVVQTAPETRPPTTIDLTADTSATSGTEIPTGSDGVSETLAGATDAPVIEGSTEGGDTPMLDAATEGTDTVTVDASTATAEPEAPATGRRRSSRT